jgi:hypothetical protein
LDFDRRGEGGEEQPARCRSKGKEEKLQGCSGRGEAGWLKSPYFYFILYHIYLLLCCNHKGRNKLKKKYKWKEVKKIFCVMICIEMS